MANKLNIAIHNIHELPNLFNLGIHNYIIELLKSGDVRYLYFDLGTRYLNLKTVLNIRSFYKNKDKIHTFNIPWDNIEFIFSSKSLNSKCDVLLNFNSHLGQSQFPKAVRDFNGLKIYHVNDYFWNQPGSTLNEMLEKTGVDYVMGYASHDKHCNYFQKTFPKYLGKVIPVPFGYANRFENEKIFSDRINKCVALGSVNPLRPLVYDVYNFKESSDFYPDESWFHKFRRKIVLNKERLSMDIDSMLPEFPQIKDFKYDLVKKFNEYRMFVSCESIFFFPPAKYFEGLASGSVLFCADHTCNKEFGFKDQENCVMYRLYDIEDLKEKVSYYINNEDELMRIQQRGTNFVRSKFSHEIIAKSLIISIRSILNNQTWEQYAKNVN